MKRKLTQLISVLLGVLLMVGLLIFPASGASNVYLMAVNDRVHEMTAENMPLISGATLYVPYTMLSPQDAGINLGVRAQYSASRGILAVTDGSRTVTFDTRRNTAYDNDGNLLDIWALTRDTMAYIPIHWICEYFPTISYSLNRTRHGALVRVTNSSVILEDDDEFIRAADDNLRRNLQRYLSSLPQPSPSPSPSPPPTSTVTPDPSPSPSVQPKPAPIVYLAFRHGGYTAEVANRLENNGRQALFLFTPGELIQQDDLIRRLIGSGHQVGLALTGEDTETCLAQLKEGRQLLADIARSPVLIVSADNLNAAEHTALREAGCAVWNATLMAAEMTASSLINRLDDQRANFVQFTCDDGGAALISVALPLLTGEDCRLQETLVTVLP